MIRWTLFSMAFFRLFCFVEAQDAKNIQLLDHWFSDTLTTNSSLARYSGSWGFTIDSEEYAVIGSTEGMHFFRITNDSLDFVDFVEGRYNSPFVVHREFKQYGKFGYAICDEGNSSLQIINLAFLPDSVQLLADLQDQRFGRIHTLFIDSTNALLFTCLVTPFINNAPQSVIPMRVFSLQDPLNPTLLWEGPADIPEVHDCYVRSGMAFLNCGQDGLRIYDFSMPSNPTYINNLSFYIDQGYNHQGWLSPDGKTYVFADETSGKRMKKCAIGNNFEVEVNYLFGTNFEENTVPHNLMCTDELVYCAYYNEGIRIYNIVHEPIEVGHYDTYPQDSPFNMNGAWGVFSGYPSNHLIVSDRQNGLFLLNFDKTLHSKVLEQQPFSLYPNPIGVGNDLFVRSTQDEIVQFTMKIFDSQGSKVFEIESGEFSYVRVNPKLSCGMYSVQINYTDYLGDEQLAHLKLLLL
jgi:choice-of-anchor B domain-containing protein